MTNPRYLTIGRKQNFVPAALRRPLENFRLPFLLMLAHVPLGVLLYSANRLGIIHFLIVFLFGLRRALNRKFSLEQVAPFVAYLVGVEVLWRMAQVPIFWESGKYASAAIMLVALARRGCWKIPTLPLLYLLCLLPACLLTLISRDFTLSRVLLSFNMSGPFLLFVSCWFCTFLKLDWEQVKAIFFTLIVPILGVAVTTLFYTVTADQINFNTESNHATSGGFGPNQVSAILGLGAFLCVAGYLIFKNRFGEKICFGIFAVFFAAQSVMTFSRGGIYNAVGAMLAVVLFQMTNPRQGFKRLAPIALLAAIFLLLVFPYLNDFTGGNLQARFEESDPTNRSSILFTDIEIFLENPVFGVGVGESFFQYLKLMNTITSSHTEFSRLLSEHGIFGIFAIISLFLMFVHNLRRQSSSAGRALVAGAFVWSNLFMLNAGMRLAAPAFILGLSCVSVMNLRARIAGERPKN
jgi:hypothetical protein